MRHKDESPPPSYPPGTTPTKPGIYLCRCEGDVLPWRATWDGERWRWFEAAPGEQSEDEELLEIVGPDEIGSPIWFGTHPGDTWEELPAQPEPSVIHGLTHQDVDLILRQAIQVAFGSKSVQPHPREFVAKLRRLLDEKDSEIASLRRKADQMTVRLGRGGGLL